LFIPFRSLQLAADKRLLADRFAASGVPVPLTWPTSLITSKPG
jgi:hypothetical protein